MKKIIGIVIGGAFLLAVVGAIVVVLFKDPNVVQGRTTFTKYCAACHGEGGDGVGFNAEHLDPYPRDLTDSVEPYMSEGSNEEIFSAIATGMAGVAPSMEGIAKHVHAHGSDAGEAEDDGDHSEMELGDDHDAEPHGHDEANSEEMANDDMEGMDHDMGAMADGGSSEEMADHDMEAMDHDMEAMADDEDEAMGSPLMPYWGFTLSDRQIWELVAYIRTLHSNDAEAIDFTQEMNSRRRRPQVMKEISFPDVDSHEGLRMIKKGRTLFEDRYACLACHELNGQGGKIGPQLDRAGARLNPDWVYRWIQDPQTIKKDTSMPAFGIPDQEARSITLYLMTLQAPPDTPDE